MLTVNRLDHKVRYFHMAKNTGIGRSKKNPIELGKRGISCIFGLSIYSHIYLSEIQHFATHFSWRIGYPESTGSFITCIEHAYVVVLFGFSGHDATFPLMWSRDLCDWFLIIFFIILSRSYIILLVYGLNE